MRLSHVMILAPVAVSSFSPSMRVTTCCSKIDRSNPNKSIRHATMRPLYSSEADGASNNDSDDKSDNGLVLDGLDQEMGKMSSKFSFSESDFLAAAKKRAEGRVESKNASARDSDWKTLAEEKKTEFGEIDDWENSMKEAGNQDSQILMFADPPPADGEGDGGDDNEPKLLLF